MSHDAPAFIRPYPDIIQRERDRTVRLEARRGGEVLAPTVLGSSFSLLVPGGAAIIDAQPITLVDGVAPYNILAASLPDTLALSDRYQQHWVLSIDGKTYEPRHEAAIALFEIYPPVGEVDLVLGEYPNLLEELDDNNQTVQPFLDEAWKQVVEKLWDVGRWPSLIISNSSLRRPLRQLAFFLIFKELLHATSGANRWQLLMDHHNAEWKEAWKALRLRIDHNQDGFADDDNRESSGLVHRNVHRNRRLRRSPSW